MSAMRFRVGAISLTVAVGLAVPRTSVAQSNRELTRQEQAAHVLSRLTYGARPGDITRMTKTGVDRWIDEQLRPGSQQDTSVLRALAPLRSWTIQPHELALLARTDARQPVTMMMVAPTADSTPMRSARPLSFVTATNEFVAGKLIRAQLAERQLEELMVDFWLNHFSVFSGKMPSVEAIVGYERAVIRPHALGSFRELLGAVATSPAMLFYLDNHLSRADSLHRTLAEFRQGSTPATRSANARRLGINENYARELLELHTLGVDGGYTQQDVIDVARAFTGWTLNRTPAAASGASTAATFVFSANMHDAEPKAVLGHALPEGRGIEDGEHVLDIVAGHPSTATFIAGKLARRFVSDAPPPELVERAAATFARTGGDIAETVRTIVTSPEFFSRAAFRSKIKTPYEFVLSVRRALDAPPDTSVATARIIAQLGQPTFGSETPDGWPDEAAPWMNGLALLDRVNFVHDAVAGRFKWLPTSGWSGWRQYEKQPLKTQVDGVVSLLLSGVASDPTRQLLLSTPTIRSAPPGGSPSSTRLRELIEIALSSPEFQRR